MLAGIQWVVIIASAALFGLLSLSSFVDSIE